MSAAVAKLLLASILLGSGIALLGRPLDTDDTGTVAAGQWEVEGGVDFVRAGGVDTWALTPVLACGVNERLQLDFGCDYLVEMNEPGEPAARSLNPSVQFKSRWWSTADGRLSLGLKGNLGWPVHLRGPDFGAERHGHLRLLVTREFGQGALDFNAGYDFTGRWGGGDDAWMASAGFRRPVTGALTWVGEVFATFPERDAAQAMVAMGVAMAGRAGWTVDALAGVGVGRGSADLRLVLGFVRAL